MTTNADIKQEKTLSTASQGSSKSSDDSNTNLTNTYTANLNNMANTHYNNINAGLNNLSSLANKINKYPVLPNDQPYPINSRIESYKSQYQQQIQQNQQNQQKQESPDSQKIWFDCRGEKFWTFRKNVNKFNGFASHLNSDNYRLSDICLDVDEDKPSIINMINFVSNKRFDDNERLGDLLNGFEHEPSINVAKTLIETKLKRIPKYISPSDNKLIWHDDRTIYSLSGYPAYMTNLMIRQLRKKPHSKFTDEYVGNDRHITLFK